MIAAITFIIMGLAGWAHYSLFGRLVWGPWTAWNFWFASVVIAAGVDALRADDREIAKAWAIQAIAFIVSLTVWKVSANPLVDLTLKNLIVMGLLLMIALRPETALPVLLHGGVILAAFLASQGVLPGSSQRPRAFIAWSYPDIAAGLQHASLVILGGYGPARRALLEWRARGRYVAAATGFHRVARTSKD